jgi:hypothetical protein
MAFLVAAQVVQATPLAPASLQQAWVAVALSAEQQEPDLVQVQLEKVREATVARRRVMVFMGGSSVYGLDRYRIRHRTWRDIPLNLADGYGFFRTS